MILPFIKVAVPNLFKKPSTENFPAENVIAAADYRGRIAYDGEKCINCGMCIKVCAPEAITRTFVDTPDGQDITFEFDLTSCTFCGTCQDFCDHGAIRMTRDYHMVATDPEELIVRGMTHKVMPKGRLICNSTCVYCGICAKRCPQDAITVDRKTQTWEVDEEKCTKCGTCVAACPKKALEFASNVIRVVHNDPSLCIHCELCGENCPTNAITVDRATQSWSYNPELCSHCSTCVENCPKAALSIKAIAVEPQVKCDLDSCVFCTLCAKKCPVSAIEVDRKNKTWKIDHDTCIKCSSCVDNCPKKAFVLE